MRRLKKAEEKLHLPRKISRTLTSPHGIFSVRDPPGPWFSGANRTTPTSRPSGREAPGSVVKFLNDDDDDDDDEHWKMPMMMMMMIKTTTTMMTMIITIIIL